MTLPTQSLNFSAPSMMCSAPMVERSIRSCGSTPLLSVEPLYLARSRSRAAAPAARSGLRVGRGRCTADAGGGEGRSLLAGCAPWRGNWCGRRAPHGGRRGRLVRVGHVKPLVEALSCRGDPELLGGFSDSGGGCVGIAQERATHFLENLGNVVEAVRVFVGPVGYRLPEVLLVSLHEAVNAALRRRRAAAGGQRGAHLGLDLVGSEAGRRGGGYCWGLGCWAWSSCCQRRSRSISLRSSAS